MQKKTRNRTTGRWKGPEGHSDAMPADPEVRSSRVRGKYRRNLLKGRAVVKVRGTAGTSRRLWSRRYTRTWVIMATPNYHAEEIFTRGTAAGCCCCSAVAAVRNIPDVPFGEISGGGGSLQLGGLDLLGGKG